MTLNGLLDALPIVMLIALGVVVRATGLIDARSGLVLTRLAYYVTIPAAIFTSIARSQLTRSMLLLPAFGLTLPILLAGVVYWATRGEAGHPERRGVLLVAMVVLGVFGYPFFQLFFGEPGLARMAMYDVGNSIYAGTVALWLAQRFGAQAQKADGLNGVRPAGGAVWRKVLTSPVMWAAILGVAASALSVPVVGPLGDFLNRLAAANTPLAMIAVGIFLRPSRAQGSLVARYLLIRMALGGLLAWGLAVALRMDGLDIIAATAGASLPAGTTALVYAGNEGLDTELAASVISVSVVVGAVLINVLPHLMAEMYL